MWQFDVTALGLVILLGAGSLVARAEPSQDARRTEMIERRRPVCADGPEKDAISALLARDAESEAGEAAALNDFRLMAHMTANVGGVTIRALGSTCGRRHQSYRATLGFNVYERDACMHDYAHAAMAFVKAYNIAIVRHARARGIDPCNLP
jgi:hypothetical protein